MNNIERKALELVNEKVHGSDCQVRVLGDASKFDLGQALFRAIERHEEFKREVSDALELTISKSASGYFLTVKELNNDLSRFIIAKPDPLKDAVAEAVGQMRNGDKLHEAIRAALAKRNGRIVFDD